MEIKVHQFRYNRRTGKLLQVTKFLGTDWRTYETKSLDDEEQTFTENELMAFTRPLWIQNGVTLLDSVGNPLRIAGLKFERTEAFKPRELCEGTRGLRVTLLVPFAEKKGLVHELGEEL